MKSPRQINTSACYVVDFKLGFKGIPNMDIIIATKEISAFHLGK